MKSETKLQTAKNFLTFSYSSTIFFLTDEKIKSVKTISENNNSFFYELKNNDKFSFFDFDKINDFFEINNKQNNNSSSTILFFEEKLSDKNIVLSTKAECKVLEMPLGSFSVFPPFWEKYFKEFGLLAFTNFENKTGFLINLKDLLNYYSNFELEKAEIKN